MGGSGGGVGRCTIYYNFASLYFGGFLLTKLFQVNLVLFIVQRKQQLISLKVHALLVWEWCLQVGDLLQDYSQFPQHSASAVW